MQWTIALNPIAFTEQVMPDGGFVTKRLRVCWTTTPG